MKRPFLFLFCLTALGICLLYPRDYQPDSVFPQGQYYTVTVHGRLQTYIRQGETLSLTLRDCRITYGGQSCQCRQLLVTVDQDTDLSAVPQAGNTLSVTGSLSSFQPARNPGNFDWRAYYLARHISYRIYADDLVITDTATAPFHQGLLTLRQYLTDCLQELCSEAPQTAALLSALLLGDKTALEEDTTAKYEDGGILHILTVSGLHVSLLGTVMVTLGKKLYLPPWLRSLLSSLLVLLYWQLCGAGMSAGRATIMFLCLTAAPFLGRTYDSLSALSLAGILILWDSPLMLFQAGFQLSFGAILGIQLVCPAFVLAVGKPGRPGTPAGVLSSLPPGVPATLARCWKSLAISLRFGLGLQLMLLPITIYHFFRYPLYAIFLNLLVLPLTALLFLSGAGALLATAAATFFSLPVKGSWLPLADGSLPASGIGSSLELPCRFLTFLARCLLLPCQWIFDLYDLLCEWTLTLPHASSLLGRPSTWRMVLYYGLLLLFCFLRTGKPRHVPQATAGQPDTPSAGKDPATHFAGKTLPRCFMGKCFRKRMIPEFLHRTLRVIGRIFSPAPLLFPAAALLTVLLLPLPSHSLNITFLDVGQGDCAFLKTPTGTTILIDCGSSDIKDVATYRLIPFLESCGIDQLDYVFLSHTDQDHVNGVLGWLEQGGTIGTVILPTLSDRLAHETSYQTVLTSLAKYQVPVRTFQQGMVWQEEELTLTCLAPCSPTDGEAALYADLNTASLVLLAEFQGIRILFTGDCEKEGEALLLSQLAERDITCHILKAGHHGSAYATGTAALNQLRPQAVIISCGIRNRYGHPHPTMLSRVETLGCRCHVTASCGAIVVTIQRGQAWLETYLPAGPLYYR